VILAVPDATPDTIPVEPTVAIDPLLVDQVPPDTELDNVVLLPTHTVAVPVIADGTAFTVTFTVEAADPQEFDLV